MLCYATDMAYSALQLQLQPEYCWLPCCAWLLQPSTLQVRLKDERLRQLRGAIKALEGKLAQLLKDKTDL